MDCSQINCLTPESWPPAWPQNKPLQKTVTVCDKNRNILQGLKPAKPQKTHRINGTSMKLSPDLISTSYSKGLADLQEELPTNFSWLDKRPGGIEIGDRNQYECGCCWAMSIVSVLGDRCGIKWNISSPRLSALWLTAVGNTTMDQVIQQLNSPSLDANTGNCSCGSNIEGALKWLENDNNGIKLESCWPFNDRVFEDIVSNCTMSALPPKSKFLEFEGCYNSCEKDINIFGVKPNSTKAIAIKDSNGNFDYDKTALAIKQEIYNNGPVSTAFYVPQDFMDFWNNGSIDDIYEPKTDKTEGGHGVAIIGWGEDNGKTWWQVRNSWGLTHDGKGWCKFLTSDLTDPNFRTGIDIPIQQQGSYFGGVLSFHPQDNLPNGYTPKTYTPSQEQENSHDKLSISPLILVPIILLFAILLFTFIIKLLRKK